MVTGMGMVTSLLNGALPDIVVREFASGTAAVLGFCLMVSFVFRIAGHMSQPMWWRSDTPIAAIGLFIFFFGEAGREGWIYALLSCINEHGRDACNGFRATYPFLIVFTTASIVGALTCLYAFTKRGWRPLVLSLCIALGFAVPIFLHWLDF